MVTLPSLNARGRRAVRDVGAPGRHLGLGYQAMTSAVLRRGHAAIPDPAAFERANYVRALPSWGAPSLR